MLTVPCFLLSPCPSRPCSFPQNSPRAASGFLLTNGAEPAASALSPHPVMSPAEDRGCGDEGLVDSTRSSPASFARWFRAAGVGFSQPLSRKGPTRDEGSCWAPGIPPRLALPQERVPFPGLPVSLSPRCGAGVLRVSGSAEGLRRCWVPQEPRSFGRPCLLPLRVVWSCSFS